MREGALIDSAIAWSGGVPRTFLQLIAGATFYAQLRTGSASLRGEDLADEVANQQDSIQKLLQPGDAEAITAATGTDGKAMDTERRIRLLAHGVLLELMHRGTSYLWVHPLAAHAIWLGANHG
jgi:hypothetical protein